MRVTATVAMVLVSAVLFAGSVNAECELTCAGECRQAAVMCKLGAALEAKADKMACLNEFNEGAFECQAGHHGGQLECSELCLPDLRACVREVRAGFKACRSEVRAAYGECKAEAQGWAQDFRAECSEAKAGCMAECRGEPADGGGLG